MPYYVEIHAMAILGQGQRNANSMFCGLSRVTPEAHFFANSRHMACCQNRLSLRTARVETLFANYGN